MDAERFTWLTKIAQSILSVVTPGLVVDGKWGRYTNGAYAAAPADVRSTIDMVLRTNNASVNDLYTFRQSVAKSGSTSDVWRVEVVPAMVREMRRNNFANPALVVAQMAHETGWGKSVPKSARGGNSYNYAGHKDFSGNGVLSVTFEVINGKRVRKLEPFATYKSADDFAKAHVALLLRKWPGVRDARTAQEFTDALKVGRQGGYATEKPEIYAKGLSGALRRAETMIS